MSSDHPAGRHAASKEPPPILVVLPPPKPTAASNMVPLTGVRALACLFIVFSHWNSFAPRADPYWALHPHGQPPPPMLQPPNAPAPPTPPFFVDGKRWPSFGLEVHSTVSLFFILSGFTFALGYNRGDAPLSTVAQRTDFYRRRVARLLPMYALGLLLGAIPFVMFTYPNLQGPGSMSTFLFSLFTALTFSQAVVMWQSDGWNGVLWSVSAFAICYALFPRLLASLRRRSPATLARLTHLILPAVCVSIPIGLLVGPMLAHLAPLVWVCHFSVVLRFVQFSLGVASGLHYQHSPPASPVFRLEAYSALLLLNQAACVLFTARVKARNAAVVWQTYSLLAEWFISGLLAAWLRALVSPAAARSPSARILSSAPLQSLGAISYAVYTLHLPILSWGCWAVFGWNGVHPMQPGWSSILAGGLPLIFPTWALGPFIGVILVVAKAAHHLLEAPARKRINEGASAKPPPPPPPPPADEETGGAHAMAPAAVEA